MAVIDRKILREVMQGAVRKELFLSPVIKRDYFCSLWRIYGLKREGGMKIDDAVEFLNEFRNICGDYVEFTRRFLDEDSFEVNVLYFNVDPVDVLQWNEFMDEIYRNYEPDDDDPKTNSPEDLGFVKEG